VAGDDRLRAERNAAAQGLGAHRVGRWRVDPGGRHGPPRGRSRSPSAAAGSVRVGQGRAGRRARDPRGGPAVGRQTGHAMGGQCRMTDQVTAERRVAELEQELARQVHGASVQSALHRIAALAASASDMDGFYRGVHAVLGELLYADNLYIALYDDERRLINWPYYVDTVDL